MRHSHRAIAANEHSSLREGIMLGLVVATSIWIWLALVDAVAGEPFRTATVLGGIAPFTAMHYLLNVALGVVIMAGVHGAAREPALAIGVVLLLVMIQIGFTFLTALFSNVGLGELAWLRIFGGNIVGALIAVAVLSRRHPFAARLREATDAD